MGVSGVSSTSPTQQYSQSNNTDFVQLGETRLSDVADRLGLDLNRLDKGQPTDSGRQRFNAGPGNSSFKRSAVRAASRS